MRLVLIAACCLAAGEVHADIAPLTETTLAEAIAYGQQRGALVQDPVMIRFDRIERRPLGTVAGQATTDAMRDIARHLKQTPFRFTVITPYSAATHIAAESARTFRPQPGVDIASLNRAQVVVSVEPGETFRVAQSIQTVVLKRGDAVIRPLATSTETAKIQTAMGAAKEVQTGTFTFPIDAFAPTESVTVVLVGETSNVEWTLTPEELAALR